MVLGALTFSAPLHNNPGQTHPVEVNPFEAVFSTVFAITPNHWDLVMDEKNYGVPLAGFLKGYTWRNSPVILYGDLIKTQYSFDTYVQADTMRKVKQFKTIRFKKKVIHLPGERPYLMTLWMLPGVVYEYNTQLSVGKGKVLSLVLSSKDPVLLKPYFAEYEKILHNLAKIEESF